MHLVKTFSTDFCFLSGCGLKMHFFLGGGQLYFQSCIPLVQTVVQAIFKLVQVKLLGTALKPIEIQCWRAISKPKIWEHDPLALKKKIWSATRAGWRFNSFQKYPIFQLTYPTVHEQCAKSKERGVMSRLMECRWSFLRCERWHFANIRTSFSLSLLYIFTLWK